MKQYLNDLDLLTFLLVAKIILCDFHLINIKNLPEDIVWVVEYYLAEN